MVKGNNYKNTNQIIKLEKISRDKHKQYAKWKKPEIKGHTFYDSMYIKPREWVNISRLKIDSWLSEGRVGNNC